MQPKKRSVAALLHDMNVVARPYARYPGGGGAGHHLTRYLSYVRALRLKCLERIDLPSQGRSVGGRSA